MPVLVVRGDQEKMDLAITGLLPQAEVAVIPDCGHVSNLEQPAAFTAILRRFLARV
jgi:pimeloyl-ACP methyl ester carboxylesterase